MIQPSTVQSRYSIEVLLNSGVQPLPDLAAEEFADLRRSLGKNPLADPVSVSSEVPPILLDGHQRLRAVLANGRKYVNANEVHVVEDANRHNAMDWAIRLNVNRRHLTVDQKAALALKLKDEQHWSQGRIAKAFGVSRPAVSQWLSRTPPSEDTVFVEGKDGKMYPVEPKPRTEPGAPLNPWSAKGHARKALHRALSVVRANPDIGGLPAYETTIILQEAGDLIDALERLISLSAP